MDDVCTQIASDRGSVLQKVAKGGYLCGLGAGEFLAILEGSVCVEAPRPNRDPATLLLARAGDCLAPWGVNPLGDQRSVRIRALTKVVAARAPLATIARIARDDASVVSKIILKFGEQYAELLALLAAVSERSAVQRIAATVRYVGAKLGQACPFASGVYVDTSQADIARMAGASRQTTNGVLRQLQSAGLVHVGRGKVCIRDALGLEAAARGDKVVRRFEPAASCRQATGHGPVECYPLRRARVSGAHSSRGSR